MFTIRVQLVLTVHMALQLSTHAWTDIIWRACAGSHDAASTVRLITQLALACRLTCRFLITQDKSGLQGMPLLTRLQLLETCARGLSVTQLVALRDRILNGASHS